MPLQVGNSTAQSLKTKEQRFTSIIWGAPGVGKTVLAYTAPKPIFGIQWDTEGDASLDKKHYKDEDVEILDLAKEPDSITDKFKIPDNSTLKQVEEHIKSTGFRTIIWDSATTYGIKALGHAIKTGPGFTKGANDSVSYEKPGFTGYGIKNMLITQGIRNILAIAIRCNCHLIITAHEKDHTDQKTGTRDLTTMSIGSTLAMSIPVDFSEIWHMSDVNNKRVVRLRPHGIIKPMKTRMFDASKTIAFNWTYDQATNKGITIDGLYETWKAAGFTKIAVPTG